MYEKALEIVVNKTKNMSVKADIMTQKEQLNDFCIKNNIRL